MFSLSLQNKLYGTNLYSTFVFAILFLYLLLPVVILLKLSTYVVGKLADILEDTQAAKFTDKLYVALEDFQVALQKDKAKKRKVEKYCACDILLVWRELQWNISEIVVALYMWVL